MSDLSTRSDSPTRSYQRKQVIVGHVTQLKPIFRVVCQLSLWLPVRFKITDKVVTINFFKQSNDAAVP